MKYLEYNGYTGTIEYSTEDKLLYGKVIGIRGLISFEGKTGLQLEKNFKAAIHEYLDDCKENGIDPDKPFKGSFNVRIPAELHRQVALRAVELNTSLNALVTESIRGWINQDSYKAATKIRAIKRTRPKRHPLKK